MRSLPLGNVGCISLQVVQKKVLPEVPGRREAHVQEMLHADGEFAKIKNF
jgi:hypothetical protein